jgi:hypothetical protein
MEVARRLVAFAPVTGRCPTPAIAAFTPHLNGAFGLTTAEFDLRVNV